MRTTQTQIVMPSHVNGAYRLFGGQLVAWIDICAAVEARRHAKGEVITVVIDHLEFLKSALVNDTVVLEAEVTWTGSTSLEVRVESFVEKLTGERELINRAYLVFVAIGADGAPVRVQSFVPETPEQAAEYERAIKRREYRRANQRP